MWMSAAQMSLSVLRGGGALGPPTAPRGAPGPSLLSGGSPEAELSSVINPVLGSTPNVAKPRLSRRQPHLRGILCCRRQHADRRKAIPPGPVLDGYSRNHDLRHHARRPRRSITRHWIRRWRDDPGPAPVWLADTVVLVTRKRIGEPPHLAKGRDVLLAHGDVLPDARDGTR